MNGLDSRSRAAFVLLIAAQAAHSVEECVTRMYDVFAPARFVAGLFTSNLAVGFATFNAVLVLFGVWCYVARVRTPHRYELGYAWFWTILEAGNGVGHLLLAILAGGYFPGVATAPVLLAISCFLGVGLVRSNRSSRRAAALAILLLVPASPADAQTTKPGLDHPVAIVGAQYGAPTEWLGSAGMLFAPPRPFQAGTAPDSSRVGLIITGGAGSGGYRFASGATGLALEGPYLTTGFDAPFTVTRTDHQPRAAAADSTYLGGEIGVVIMSVRLSAGASHRTSGTSSGKTTIFTWSVGVQIPIGW